MNRRTDLWFNGCRALPFTKKKPFTTLFPNASPKAVDFLERTLVGFHLLALCDRRKADPLRCCFPRARRRSTQRSERQLKKRLHILMSKHMYVFISFNRKHLSSLFLFISPPPCRQHDPDDEPTAPPLDPEFFEFDLHKDISRDQLKELLYAEILAFNPAPLV